MKMKAGRRPEGLRQRQIQKSETFPITKQVRSSWDIEHIDDLTTRLLGNADVLNINQDDKKETVMLENLAD
jgi:hypothetical protein